jgi:hypothetical protein
MIDDLHDYPGAYIGTRRYVSVRGYSRSIPKYKTYKGSDGYNYVLPEYGGTVQPCASGSSFMILPDKLAYVSPIDGSEITSRSTHRDHMKRHNVVEAPDRQRRQESGTNDNIVGDVKAAWRELESR